MNARLRIVVAVIGLWCVALTAKLVGLQIVDHDQYSEKARRQHQRVVDLDPSRGTVFDAAGRELAVSVPVDSAWADPARVPEERRGEIAQQVAEVLEVPVTEIAAELAKDNKSFVYLGRRLDPPKAEALRALALPGVFFAEESKRYYPNRTLAAPVLGYVGTDNAGLAGLELEYNAAVTGRAGRRTVLRDAKASTAISPDLAASAAQPGHDLVLTLDASIQHVVERSLAEAVEKHHARRAMAVVLNPNTGAVLAMASLPSFDSNRFAEAPKEHRQNFAIESSYEPGSTFKMVTASAALAANLIDPADVIDCEMGGITYGSTRIKDHKPFGRLTFREVIAKSSNVGAIKAGMKLGDERLYDAAHAFGFGRRTGIDLPGESSGILHPLDKWWSLSRAYVSFGHEISITALQLASAFGAVANGGSLMRPYIVAEVRAEGKAPVVTQPEVVGRPVTSSTAREVERLLESVILEGGTGKAAAIPGYTVAGKTGTAQKVSQTGRYLPGRYVASFAGFAPARRPEVVAAVVIDEPRPPWYHGGDVAAPVFSAMVEQILLYRGVRPERDKPERWPGETRSRTAALEAPAPDWTSLAAATAGGAP
ncbi:MAG: penicillin-binding protein 2 [Acidobacteriota bacterium]